MVRNARRKVLSEARQRAKNYKRAVKYLYACTHFTYEDLIKTNRIAGNVMLESELRRYWKMSKRTFEGTESVKKILGDTLIKGIVTFESVAKKLEKKWWQFWK